MMIRVKKTTITPTFLTNCYKATAAQYCQGWHVQHEYNMDINQRFFFGIVFAVADTLFGYGKMNMDIDGQELILVVEPTKILRGGTVKVWFDGSIKTCWIIGYIDGGTFDENPVPLSIINLAA